MMQGYGAQEYGTRGCGTQEWAHIEWNAEVDGLRTSRREE